MAEKKTEKPINIRMVNTNNDSMRYGKQYCKYMDKFFNYEELVELQPTVNSSVIKCAYYIEVKIKTVDATFNINPILGFPIVVGLANVIDTNIAAPVAALPQDWNPQVIENNIISGNFPYLEELQ